MPLSVSAAPALREPRPTSHRGKRNTLIRGLPPSPSPACMTCHICTCAPCRLPLLCLLDHGYVHWEDPCAPRCCLTATPTSSTLPSTGSSRPVGGQPSPTLRAAGPPVWSGQWARFRGDLPRVEREDVMWRVGERVESAVVLVETDRTSRGISCSRPSAFSLLSSFPFQSSSCSYQICAASNSPQTCAASDSP